jgi:hypothetical protein
MKKLTFFIALMLTISTAMAQKAAQKESWSKQSVKTEKKQTHQVLQQKHRVINPTSQWANISTQKQNVAKIVQNAQSLDYTAVTLPLDTTFVFSQANVSDLSELFIGSPIVGVVFKFTVTQPKFVTLGEENSLFDIGFFKDQCDLYHLLTNGSTITQLLTPGDYFVVLADFPEDADGIDVTLNQTVHFTISQSDVDITPLTLDVDNNYELNSTNTVDVEGTLMRFFSFTLADVKMIDYAVEGINGAGVEIYYDGNLVGAGNRIFPAGTHYFAIMDYNNAVSATNSITAHITIEVNQDVAITQIPIPYEGSFTITENDPMVYGAFHAKYFTFTILETMNLSFYTNNNNPYIELYDINYNYINDGYNISQTLPAGTYLLSINDDYNTLPLTSTLYIQQFINYWDLDYSQEMPFGQQIAGSDEDLVPNVSVFGVNSFVAPYSFQATAGNMYKITLNAFAPQNGIGIGCFIFHEELEQDFWTDVVFWDSNGNSSTSLSWLTGFTAMETEIVQFAFASTLPNVYYTIKIDEVSTTTEAPHPGDFAFAEMTLPFSQVIGFDPAQFNNVIVDGTDIYKAYHLNVAEAINLKYMTGSYTNENNGHYFATPLIIYSDETLSNAVTPNGLWNSEDINLLPGDYYILFYDNECYDRDGVYMTPTVYIDYAPYVEPQGGVTTLYDLLTDTEISTVDYTTEIPFSESGWYVEGISAKVLGENSANYDFRYTGETFFAKAYKVTGMISSDLLKIHVAHSNDAYMHVYKIIDNQIYGISDWSVDDAYDDDGTNIFTGQGWNGDSYYELTADDAIDYYVVATTYGSDNNNDSRWAVTMWTNASEPTIDTDPEYPDFVLPEIVSTQTATAVLNLQAPISDSEIKIALMALNVTATDENNNTFAVINNPYAWEINAEQTTATFENYSNPNYTLATNYAPATVALNITSGIEEVGANSIILYPNPAVDNINIDGLQGGEIIKIIDINGRIISTLTAKSNIQNISVNGLAQGTYLVAIQNGNTIKVLKFVK